MKKKLLIIVTLVFGMNNIYASESVWTNFQKMAGVVGIGVMLGAGQFASKQNEEYHNQNKRPNWNMRFYKALGIGSVLLATDILAHDMSDTKLNLCKLAAFTVSLLGVTDTAGNLARQLPIIGGLLADPIDKEGNEMKDSGTFMRGLLIYAPLRLTISKYFYAHI